LVFLANVAEKRPRWKPVVLLLLVLFNTLLGLMAAGFLILFALDFSLEQVELPPPGVGVVLLLTAVVGGLVLIPAVRRRLATVLPIRPESPVHLTALVLACYLASWSLINLFAVGGVQGLQDAAETVPISLYILQSTGLVIFALAGVGLFVRRSRSQIVDRLGLRQFHWSSPLVAAAAVVVLMAINFTIIVCWLLLDREGLDAIGQVSEVMMGDFDSFGTILLLAVLSSLSEEILFRGALQPRLGLVFTSFVFASTHLQYAISPATLVVLLIGIVLGLLRRYFGTWTAVMTHFGYNFSLLLMGLLASKLSELVG